MKTEKIKNYNQKILAISGTIIIIIGIALILGTIKETEDVRENLNVFALKKFVSKDLKYYDFDLVIIRDCIADGSKKKFNEYKNNVKYLNDSLTNEKVKLDEYLSNMDDYPDNKEIAEDVNKVQRLNRRIEKLKETLNNLEALDSSSFTFKLKELPANASMGNLTYDINDGAISINYIEGSIHNFIHEATHAYQLCIGDIAFITFNGKPTASDLFDEVWAYKAQYAYNPYSVEKIISSKPIKDLKEIDTLWVRNVEALIYPYKDSPPYNVNIDTTLDTIIKVYPNMKFDSLIKLKNIQEIPEIKQYILKKTIDKETILYDLREIYQEIDFNKIIRLKNIPGIIIKDSLLLNEN